MNSSEEEQIYSIALTMVPGIGHIGAKHLIDGMGNAVDVFRLRKEIPERIPEVSQRVIEALDCPQAVLRAEQEYEFIRKNPLVEPTPCRGSTQPLRHGQAGCTPRSTFHQFPSSIG